jgi:hypothetical protein
VIIRSLRVEARSESEAAEYAVRIADCLSDIRQVRALREVRHHVASSRRLLEPRLTIEWW